MPVHFHHFLGGANLSQSNQSAEPALVAAGGKKLSPREVRTGLYRALSGHAVDTSEDLTDIVPKVVARLEGLGWHPVTIERISEHIDDLIDPAGSLLAKKTTVVPGFRDKIAQTVLAG